MAIPRESGSTDGRRPSRTRSGTSGAEGRSQRPQRSSGSSRRSSLQAPPEEPRTPPRRSPKKRAAPSRTNAAEEYTVNENGEKEFTRDGKTYRIDKVTGKAYRVIPHSQASGVKDSNGYAIPKLQVPDIGGFDADDMDRSAEEFLAHLRVAPSREEQARLRAEMQRREIERNKKYLQDNEEIIAKAKKEEEEARRLYGEE